MLVVWGEICKWLKHADCKSVLFEFAGSNPALTTTYKSLHNKSLNDPAREIGCLCRTKQYRRIDESGKDKIGIAQLLDSI